MTSRSESKLKEMKIIVGDNFETLDTETDKKEFKVLEVREEGYKKEGYMKVNEDEKEMEKEKETKKEFCDNLIWQKESMKISLNAHYQLFIELMEREKEGVTLVREREEIRREGHNEKRDDTRKQKKDGNFFETEGTVKMQEENDQEKGKGTVEKNKEGKEKEIGGKNVENLISRTETENTEKEEQNEKKNVKKNKKQKKVVNYLKDANSGMTYLTPQSIFEQLHSLSKYEKNSFEKYPKLRKLLRKALKV